MTLIQDDDFLPADVADEVERVFLSTKYAWNYYANVNYSSPPPDGLPGIFQNDGRFGDSFGFASLIFPSPQPNAPGFDPARRVLEIFLSRHGVMPQQLLRIKANLLTRHDQPKPFTPHVDMPRKHWAMIYYVNDSDGDTVLLDKTYPEWANSSELKRIAPKKGRAVLFDGSHYHCGTAPTFHDVRVVLNYNFV